LGLTDGARSLRDHALNLLGLLSATGSGFSLPRMISDLKLQLEQNDGSYPAGSDLVGSSVDLDRNRTKGGRGIRVEAKIVNLRKP
jgi:hypothetical protein